jgi:LuxR family transcriptional regulator, maltose regulon positive regulatory protein
MVLSGRAQPSRRVGTLRARGLALEIGPDELRMGAEDARGLLNAAEVAFSDTELSELVEKTEGWPAGLYLAALAARASEGKMTGSSFRGDDPYLSDYLRTELLARLPEDELRFLTRTSVLERMSGPLCDEVLQSAGSEERLASLERSNLFVVALDRGQEWYRAGSRVRAADLEAVGLGRPDLPERPLSGCLP